MDEEREDTTVYSVVVNLEEQYAIWRADKEPPAGWRKDGKSGLKKECLDYIEEVWTDMRPLTLRRHMEQEAAGRGKDQPIQAAPSSSD